MKKVKMYSVIFCLLLLIFVPLNSTELFISEANAQTNPFGGKINNILQNSDLKGNMVGVSVRNATNGKVIYEKNGSVRLRPASNMKLITAATALKTLGPKYTFSTEVLSDGSQKGKVLSGNLYLKGKGDPTLLEKDFQELALKLKQKGITRIKGNLVGDDTWYDKERYAIDTPWSDEQEYYAAGISALTASPNEDYDAGTVMVNVKPQSPGEMASISVTPKTNYVQIHNKVKTVNSSAKKNITITRQHGNNKITIEGTIPAGSSPDKSWVAVWEPTGYALNLFKTALQKQGITIDGKVTTGNTPQKARVLAADRSIPLSKLAVPFMKLSNNTHAEMLIKEMGKVKAGEGSWEKGLKFVKGQLQGIGVNGNTILMRDGSGLSHVNLVSPNELTSLLYNVQDETWFPAFKNSLPIAGNSNRMIGGTLRNRMKGTAAEGKVIAKTGSITSVSSLSGYVTTQSGAKLAFSIIINNTVNEDNLRKVEDQIAVALAQY
ncbi:D-alanyl-D-alanine carboxypeptidase/D-alanyl-D-alanine-endopeptidase [Bacillus sp. JJ722]